MKVLGRVQTRGFTDGYTVDMGIENKIASFCLYRSSCEGISFTSSSLVEESPSTQFKQKILKESTSKIEISAH